MRWHGEHGIGHMWAPKASTAVGAMRCGHDLFDWEAYEGKYWAANETLAIYRWQNCGTDVIFQESSSSRDDDIVTCRLFPKVRLGWLAPPALRLALRYICMQSHYLRLQHSLPT